MAGLDKVIPGESNEIPFTTHNAFVDAARDYISRSGGTAGPVPPDQPTSNNFVLIQNNTGEDLERFDIVGVDAAVIKPDNNPVEFATRRIMSSAIPTVKDYWGRFAIMTVPVAKTKFGLACISGIYIALVDVLKETHIFADVKTDEVNHLKSDDSGAAQILWKQSEDPDSDIELGIQWAVLRLGVPFLAHQRVWVIIREVEFDGVTWVWVERARPSDDYDTNGGLFTGMGPPAIPPVRLLDAEGEPVNSDSHFENLGKGWEQMVVDPHRISDDYRPAVWTGRILTREPDIFPAERTGGNWHIGANWRFDVRELAESILFGSCRVSGV